LVWAANQPSWIIDVTTEPNFTRAAAAASAGLRGGFGFPIRFGDDVLGVAEFFSRESRRPDAELLRVFDTLGNQIGQFIDRKRVEEALRQSEGLKAAIVASALDCIVTMDTGGRIVEFNPAAERTFGHPRAAVMGKAVADALI